MTLDHILLGCSSLESGIAFVEKYTGVSAQFGGVHAGMGTCNALLSLGGGQYLEILAPDPEQTGVRAWAISTLPEITALTTPRLIGWAIGCDDIDSVTERLRRAGIDIRPAIAGTRRRSDGSVLKWKMATLENDYHGTLPFFVEWDRESMHPSKSAPTGCRLERFKITAPANAEIERFFRSLPKQLRAERGDTLQLGATLAGPGGTLLL